MALLAVCQYLIGVGSDMLEILIDEGENKLTVIKRKLFQLCWLSLKWRSAVPR